MQTSLPPATLPWFRNPLSNGCEDLVLNDALQRLRNDARINQQQDLHIYDISPNRTVTLSPLSLSLALREVLDSSQSSLLSNVSSDR